MNINLKDIFRQGGTQQVFAEIKTRLPAHINGPCRLTCVIEVTEYEGDYLLKLSVDGELTIICQRCLEPFSTHYHHEAQFAIGSQTGGADRPEGPFERMIAKPHQIDLIEILTDDLHLFTPEKHADLEQCDDEMKQFLQGK